MSRARPLAVVGLGILATIAAAALPARAQEEEPQGTGPQPMDGWTFEDVEATVSANTVTVTGTVTPPDALLLSYRAVTRVDVELERTADAVTACPTSVTGEPESYPENDDDAAWAAAPPAPEPVPEEQRSRTFSLAVDVPCNGIYTASLSAIADRSGPPAGENSDDATTDEPFEVAVPPVDEAPPASGGVVAVLGADRHVTVAWQPPVGWGQATSCSTAVSGPPDFVGYVLNRTIDGTTTRVATVAPGTQCATDVLAADAALGSYRYDVYAVRAGSAGNVLSEVAASTVVTVGPPTSAVPTATTEVRPPQGTIRVGGGASSGGVASGTVPPTAPDGTFEPTLDYDDEEPGELAAEVPDDADTFLDFVPGPGAGILKPLAIAACLAAWAMHLRYLARRADDVY